LLELLFIIMGNFVNIKNITGLERRAP